ncbi:MAG: hypothetical protein HQK57_00610 [Deltaproteobacteria bacterium]|nr:hypothetical protein [Deltaproteobacteria bacterium]
MSSPEELLLDHLDELTAAFLEHSGKNQNIWKSLCQNIPGLTEAMTANTFEAKAPTIVATVTKLSQYGSGKVGGGQVDVDKITLGHKEEMDKLRQELQAGTKKLSQQLAEATLTIVRLINDAKLNRRNHEKVGARIPQESQTVVTNLTQSHPTEMDKLAHQLGKGLIKKKIYCRLDY